MRLSPAADGLFVDGNPAAGQVGTVVNAAWLNMIQAEIISVLTAAGIAVDAAKPDQLATAVNTLLRGRATVNVAGGASITLTAAQAAMPIMILTGALTANISLIFPASSGSWIVRNQTTGAFTVTCKTAAGTGVVVSQGTSNALWGDGTNIYPEQSDWANMRFTGQVGIGTDTPGSALQLGGGGAYAELRMRRSVDGGGAQVVGFFKSRGTESTPTAVISGDEVGGTYWSAHDGAGWRNGAIIEARVEGVPSLNTVPMSIRFATAAVGGAATERMRINAAGRLLIGKTTDDGNALLQVAGSVAADALEIKGAGTIATFSTDDMIAANNAGVRIVNVASPTAASRQTMMLLDPSGADGSGVDYSVLRAYGDGTTELINHHSAGSLVFGTAATERMRINAAGRLLIGKTTDDGSGRLQVAGLITADTPAIGDSGKSVATIDAVARTMGSYRGYRNLTANAALTAADVGFYIGISAAGLTVTLPAGAGVPVGSTFTFGSQVAFTITAAAGNTISQPSVTTQASAVMYGFCSIVWRGDMWQIVMGGDQCVITGGQLFDRSPDGIIVQTGVVNTAAGATSVTFPFAFPNAVLACVPQLREQSSGLYPTSCFASGVSNAGFTLVLGGYTSGNNMTNYIAIGR